VSIGSHDNDVALAVSLRSRGPSPISSTANRACFQSKAIHGQIVGVDGSDRGCRAMALESVLAKHHSPEPLAPKRCPQPPQAPLSLRHTSLHPPAVARTPYRLGKLRNTPRAQIVPQARLSHRPPGIPLTPSFFSQKQRQRRPSMAPASVPCHTDGTLRQGTQTAPAPGGEARRRLGRPMGAWVGCSMDVNTGHPCHTNVTGSGEPEPGKR
jgi:hypothetical protein